jgi:hypothetical protein
VTVEFLYGLWEKQGGICALSGIKMELPKTTTKWKSQPNTPNRVSLDRINNDIPYLKDNVRFVTYMANVCRNKFTDEEVIEFCGAVVKNNT